MKRLLLCGLFILVLPFSVFFFGRLDLFLYWGMVISASTLVGTFFGTAFGAIDMHEATESTKIPAHPIRSKQL